MREWTLVLYVKIKVEISEGKVDSVVELITLLLGTMGLNFASTDQHLADI